VLIVLLCFVGSDCHSLQQENLGNLTDDLTLHGSIYSGRGNRLRFSQVGWPVGDGPVTIRSLDISRRTLPKGELRIARQFTAGVESEIAQVPKGRLNPFMSYVSSYSPSVFSYGSDSAVPSGLGLLFHHPTLERVGYSRASLREKGLRSVVRFRPVHGRAWTAQTRGATFRDDR
jgi:hypothetical protein